MAIAFVFAYVSGKFCKRKEMCVKVGIFVNSWCFAYVFSLLVKREREIEREREREKRVY